MPSGRRGQIKRVDGRRRASTDVDALGVNGPLSLHFPGILLTFHAASFVESSYHICLMYRRFVNSFVFYGLSLIATNLGGNDYLDFFISGAVEVPAYLLCYVTLTRFGRPRPLAASMTLAGLVLVVLIAIPYGQ